MATGSSPEVTERIPLCLSRRCPVQGSTSDDLIRTRWSNSQRQRFSEFLDLNGLCRRERKAMHGRTVRFFVEDERTPDRSTNYRGVELSSTVFSATRPSIC